MAKNRVQDGEILTWLNSTGSAVTSGSPIVFGLWCMAIALVDIANAASGSVDTDGVYRLTKTTGAIVQGGKVWWDATNAYCVNAPSKNSYFVGYAVTAAGSSDTTVDVSLEEFCYEGQRILTLAATGNETLGVGDFASGDLTLLVPNTGAKTLNLPAVATIPIGAKLWVKKTTADAQVITIDPNSSEQINGGNTYASIDANGDNALFYNTGTAWVLLESTIA